MTDADGIPDVEICDPMADTGRLFADCTDHVTHHIVEAKEHNGQVRRAMYLLDQGDACLGEAVSARYGPGSARAVFRDHLRERLELTRYVRDGIARRNLDQESDRRSRLRSLWPLLPDRHSDDRRQVEQRPSPGMGGRLEAPSSELVRRLAAEAFTPHPQQPYMAAAARSVPTTRPTRFTRAGQTCPGILVSRPGPGEPAPAGHAGGCSVQCVRPLLSA
ncbi:hypothetical protein GCM10010507_10080 [Streptomyces cinnamoneus]|uniref:Uncharacterized protein n=1 Tax=Streptomyces cinnamoneus TaxID=53446 RepID=A0A918TA91_STRCJ|nr:hypothetical protein GCM10010507_10080 [Streptomyces cinnamoneus]